jgi:hypothetical protein
VRYSKRLEHVLFAFFATFTVKEFLPQSTQGGQQQSSTRFSIADLSTEKE